MHFLYDKEFDALMLMFLNPEESDAVVYYVDDYVALLYNPENKEIVGIQIESFQKSFLRRHKNVAKVWQFRKAISEEAPEDFGDLIIEFEKRKPELAREVIKSASPLFPDKFTNLTHTYNFT